MFRGTKPYERNALMAASRPPRGRLILWLEANDKRAQKDENMIQGDSDNHYKKCAFSSYDSLQSSHDRWLAQQFFDGDKLQELHYREFYYANFPVLEAESELQKERDFAQASNCAISNMLLAELWANYNIPVLVDRLRTMRHEASIVQVCAVPFVFISNLNFEF